MHLRSLPTMERISVPVRRHPEHYFVVQRSVRLIAIILYQGYNTLKQGLFLIKAVTALLRESHTLNKAVTAVFTSKAAARYKAVIVLRHTTALLRDPYCILLFLGACTAGRRFFCSIILIVGDRICVSDFERSEHMKII